MESLHVKLPILGKYTSLSESSHGLRSAGDRLKEGMIETENTGSRRNRSGEATRAKVMKAAIALMAERGFAALTLQAVADRAEIRYGNLTHHYATRDILIEALLETLLDRYRAQFEELAEAIAVGGDGSFRDVVGWLLDDAVKAETGPVFLELWTMANHMPSVAAAMEALYDEAVSACIKALGVSSEAAVASGLRDALYLLGTVLEGSSAIFSSRNRNTDIYRGFRGEAFEMLIGILESRLEKARDLMG